MKAPKLIYKEEQPIVPVGWHKLKLGEVLQKGDMFPCMEWWSYTNRLGNKCDGYYIRRKNHNTKHT